MPCTPDNTCVHQLAAGLITVADFCPTCTSFLIAGMEWVLGPLEWHEDYLKRATLVPR
jgi:hypothetical protein